jgi:hypothetical protein
MRRPAVWCALWALPLLAVCSGQGTSARDAELAELRARVERMERESAEERARLAEDLRALRQSMDEAGRRADRLGQDGAGAAPQDAERPGKSPRAALKQSFNEAWEASRQALARLNKSLEESLSRGGVRRDAEPFGPSGPAAPSGGAEPKHPE